MLQHVKDGSFRGALMAHFLDPFPITCDCLFYVSVLCYNPLLGRAGGRMRIEEMKAHLRALLHQRDMLRFERDSLELFDLMEELEQEIHELEKQLRKSA